jgi:ketosteroid isomerase-like protein
MNATTEEQVRELGCRWVEAERHGDAVTLAELATDDFTLVGPAGFVLKKEQWLDRYRSGALTTRSLSWDDVEVRDYGSVAVAVGRQTQEAAYQGHPADGQFRGTHIVVQRDGRWLLAGIHLSAIAGPPAGLPRADAGR